MRASPLEQEMSEKKRKRWGLRWTLFPASHGKYGFRSLRTKGQCSWKEQRGSGPGNWWSPKK